MALQCLRTLARALPRLPPITIPHQSTASTFIGLKYVKNTSPLHTSSVRLDLSEFFETERNRGETKVRVGREWKTDELRLKSNEDLHKLWFILLKERNMLLTMQHAYQEDYVAMPNPERIDKVEMSMENLEEVVRERNRAFHNLEVGISGERERTFRPDWTGRLVPYKPLEHAVPVRMNTSYRRKLRFKFMNRGGEDVADFQRRYREKLGAIDRVKQLREMREAARVVRRFPNVSLEALQDQYPLVDLDRLMRWKKIRGANTAHQDI